MLEQRAHEITLTYLDYCRLKCKEEMARRRRSVARARSRSFCPNRRHTSARRATRRVERIIESVDVARQAL